MSDTVSEYTLLIVESPTLAKQLQQIAPSHVNVFATGGFLWKPMYDSQKNRLDKKAIPEKLELRNELRREAAHAVNIIVATDSDPSGDFIAWTIHKELRTANIKRGNLSSVSASALKTLINSAKPIDFETLFKRLQNRYRIRHLWSEYFSTISMKLAGAIAAFSSPIKSTTFLDEDGNSYFSNEPTQTELNTTYRLKKSSTEHLFVLHRPLSAFDVIERLRESSPASTYSDVQALLQKTFEATHPHTGQGLITYPRTESRAFFPSTWQDLQNQWIKEKSLNEFIPEQLQQIASTNVAHDAIRPLKLDVAPLWIETHLPSDIGAAYRLIYSHTLTSIRLPKPATSVFVSSDNEMTLYSHLPSSSHEITVRPILTLSELGHQLCSLGVLRPSGFGSFADEAIKTDLFRIRKSGEVIPGDRLKSDPSSGLRFSSILKKLRAVADNPHLQDETISRILSS